MEGTMRVGVGVTLCAVLFFAGIGAPLAQGTVDNLIRQRPAEIYLPGARTRTETAAPDAVKPLNSLAAEDRIASADAPDLVERTRDFIRRNAANLGISAAGELEATAKRNTLLGPYLEFRQSLNGIPISSTQVGVSLTPDGRVNSVSSKVVQIPTVKAAEISKSPTLKESDALQIAWEDLRPSGELLEPATVTVAYTPEKNALTLTYIVSVAVAEPFGYWRYEVDATTGRILSKTDRRIKEGKDKRFIGEGQYTPPDTRLSLENATQMLKARGATNKAEVGSSGKVGSASALVFDPDPITTLKDPSLVDGSSQDRFAKAYVTVTLQGMTQTADGTFHLTGPSVRIEDFEPGDGGQRRPPSTATSGWTALRGNNAFNDAMTYYYLENSISYLRRLGFNGDRELFPSGIAADSDGVGGDDNSHYVPGSDRLAFGHGCVDDNEDVDVILHELGHAITSHVNSSWSGGDTGAIGEGFGDYWAASYSLRARNGADVDPAKVFTWDGIPSCWSGRRLDRTGARYDSSRTYFAHQNFSGFVSDELWSTPLFQTLLALLARGETAESVDAIILTGMQTMGPDITMRALALNTVLVAKSLSPGRPHAEVLEAKFRDLGIIE
jgi:hypothetical protein